MLTFLDDETETPTHERPARSAPQPPAATPAPDDRPRTFLEALRRMLAAGHGESPDSPTAS